MLISARQIGSPKRVLRFDKFMDGVSTRLDYSRTRFRNTEILTNKAIQFFTGLLTHIFDEGMLKKDMLDVYLNELVFMVPSVSGTFDNTQTGIVIPGNLFIQGDVEEILIPTSGLIGTAATVLDSWDVWKNIKPVKLVACDSRELMTKWLDVAVYTKDKPSYAVFTIDTAALLIKYLVYLRTFEIGLSNPNISTFIRQHIIYDLYDDFIEVWTHKLLLDVSNDTVPAEVGTSSIINQSQYKMAVAEVQELYYDFVRGQFRLATFLNTKFYSGRSITDMVYMYENTYATPSSNRYIGYQLLKMADTCNLVVNSLLKSRDRGLESAAIVKMVKDARMLNRSSWRSHVRVPKVITEVEALCANIENMGFELT